MIDDKGVRPIFQTFCKRPATVGTEPVQTGDQWPDNRGSARGSSPGRSPLQEAASRRTRQTDGTSLPNRPHLGLSVRSPICLPPAGRRLAFLPTAPGIIRPASGPGRSVHTVASWSSHLSDPASKIPQIPRYDKKNKLEICQLEVDRRLEGEKQRKRRGYT